MKVKSIIAAAACALILMSCSCSNGKKSSGPQAGQLSETMASFKNDDNVQFVEFSGIALGLGKLALQATPVRNISKNITKISILTAIDAAEDVKAGIVDRFSTALSTYDLLLCANDGEEGVEIYGVTENEDTFKEIIVFVKNEATVIAMTGDVAMEDVTEMIEKEAR